MWALDSAFFSNIPKTFFVCKTRMNGRCSPNLSSPDFFFNLRNHIKNHQSLLSFDHQSLERYMKECKNKILKKISRRDIKKDLNKISRELMKRCLWAEHIEWLYFHVGNVEKIGGTKRKFETTYVNHIDNLNTNKRRKKAK